MLLGLSFPGCTNIRPSHLICAVIHPGRRDIILFYYSPDNPANAAESPSYLQSVGHPVRGFRRPGPLWGQLCKLWEETPSGSCFSHAWGGGVCVRATMSISRTLSCDLEATTPAHTSPRSWCPASSRGLPPPRGNSALVMPAVLPWRMLPTMPGSLRGPLSPVHGLSLSSLWDSGRLSPQPCSSQSPLHQVAGSDFTSGSPTPCYPPAWQSS